VANRFLATTLLLNGIREYSATPASDLSAQQATLLELLNREARTYLADFILGAGGGHYLVPYDVTLVAGTMRYRLPPRATASAIHLAQVVSADGSNPLDLVPTDVARVPDVQTGRMLGDYFFRGNHLEFVPPVAGATGQFPVAFGGSAATLRLWYFRRLSEAVDSASCGEALSVSAPDINIGAVADSALTAATSFDVIQGAPPFDVLAADAAATWASPNFTFSTAVTDVAAGDWVALPGRSPFINAPLELQDLLVARCAEVYLRPRAPNASQAAAGARMELEAAVRRLITPRTKAVAPVLVNRYGVGWGRGTRRSRQ
jgi:hypothetical protein